MSFDPYVDNLGNPAIRHRENLNSPEHRANLATLANHMYKISDDPEGLDPALYLSPEDAMVCAEVVADENAKDVAEPGSGWKNSSTIDLRAPNVAAHTWNGSVNALMGGLALARIKRKPRAPTDAVAWNSPLRTAKAGLTKSLFFPKSESHRGYFVGRLSLALGQDVMLCDDGKLRSKRGMELQKSKGVGWGRLPDPDKLEPALKYGFTTGVEYRNKKSWSLRKLLDTQRGS